MNKPENRVDRIVSDLLHGRRLRLRGGDAEEKAARMQKDAEFLVEQETRQMQQDLWREAVEKATATAEDLLRKRVTDADQERLAEEYLSELGRRPLAPSASGAKAGTS